MAGTYPPAMKLAASWFVTDRGLAVGSLVGALTLGGAVPHLINVAGGLAWRPVIAGTSLAALGAAVVMATLVRDGPHVQARAPFNPRCVQELVRSRAVVLASLGYFGHMWELYAMWTWIGLYLLEAFTRAGLPAALASRGDGDRDRDRRRRGELRPGGLRGRPHRPHGRDHAGDGRAAARAPR